jgi:hypothetical protein
MGCGGIYPQINGICAPDIPYPIVSHESVPSLIDNLTYALYGTITKNVTNGRVTWTIPCDPTNTASFFGVPRNTGEGLLCYIIRSATAFVGSAPTQNGQLTLVPVSNTQVKIQYKGSDGVVRSNTLTLS